MLLSFRKVIFRAAALGSSLIVAICRVIRRVRVVLFLACQLFVAGFAVCILQFKLSLKELFYLDFPKSGCPLSLGKERKNRTNSGHEVGSQACVMQSKCECKQRYQTRCLIPSCLNACESES